MTIVRFLKNSSPYAAGELAGFDAEYAKKLVHQQIAEEVEAPKPAKK